MVTGCNNYRQHHPGSKSAGSTGRVALLKRNPIRVPCSPSVLVSLSLALVYLFSLARGSYGVSLGEVAEPIPQLEDDKSSTSPVVDAVNLSSSSSSGISSNRVKRSRDVQQLCGYRLLNALNRVCDRNFVGFTRRSDPSFLGTITNIGGDGQSGEDVFVASESGSSLYPWDVALLSLEYPPHGSSSSLIGGGDAYPSNNPGNWEGSAFDYLELLPQQPLAFPPVVSSPWANSRSNGNNNAGAAGRSSSKAFALKMLTEPPKTHQRFRRNIVDECCHKPCAMNQMLKYCAVGVGKRSY